ncbi:hypothetical protein EMPG_09390 [Blastomyces silverae]|uniref:Homeobox domain-containing protein n=1 Tax=Blastomyces silverae TaxID=2060906 RepID=A0A0H1BRL7_9EURO|nr:hypothetical protein EMPG_09390 [Blastomyces silverae]
MASLMSPISMRQVDAGWNNQQLEPWPTVTQTRNFRPFPTVMNDRDLLQIDPIDRKRVELEPRAHLSVAPASEIKGHPTLNFKNSIETETQNEIRNIKAILPETETEYLEGNFEFSMPSTSPNSISGAYLTSNPVECDKVKTNDNDAEDEGDCENELNIDICDDQLEREIHEGNGQRQPGGGGHTKVTADRQPGKGKMKRFRLSHNQTRFLMNEFASQAHPDAAHRERLSKEIPGLSPRQVQVWFQNRRAKLKRLTSDDRERVLISRALAEGFDIARGIHSPCGSWHQSSHTLASPGSYLNANQEGGEGDILTPLMVDIVGRISEEDYATSPLSASSNYGSYFPSPASASASGSELEMSPITIGGDIASHCPSFSNPQTSTFQYMSPCTSPGSFSHSASQTSYHHIQAMQQPNTTRQRAGSLGTPPRASISYTQAISEYGTPDPAYMGLDMPYNNTHSYENITSQTYMGSNISQAPHSQLRKSGPPPPKPSSLRLRTAPTSLPPELHLNTEYWKQGDDGLQSAPLPDMPILHEDQLSPFSTTTAVGSNPFGISYPERNSSSLSLPASFIPY